MTKKIHPNSHRKRDTVFPPKSNERDSFIHSKAIVIFVCGGDCEPGETYGTCAGDCEKL